MSELIILFSIALVTLVGYIFIKLFKLSQVKDNLFILGCSYGVGVGLISLQLFIYSQIGIKWDKGTILMPMILFIFLYLYLQRKTKITFKKLNLKHSKLFYLLIFLILITFGYVFFEAIIRPLMAYDSWAIWLMKSKIFFIDGKINADKLVYLKSDYPLTISLLGTFCYIMLGRINDTAVLLTSSAFYISILLVFFAFLKRRFDINYALLFTFLFATTQNFIRHGGRIEAGLADLPMAYFMLISIILLLEYFKNKTLRNLIFINIILGFTTLIKFEGIPFTILIQSLILFDFIRRKDFRYLYAILIWLIPLIYWQNFINIHGMRAISLIGSSKFNLSLDLSINIFKGIGRELVNIKTWNLIWIVYFYSFFVINFKKNSEIIIINAIIILQFLIYLLLYFLFPFMYGPESSIERLLLHLAPLAMLIISISFHPIYIHFLKNKKINI